MSESGFWVVFEGGDSVGKTTQIERLVSTLSATGVPVVQTREPGGTDLGKTLRQTIMHGGHIDPRAEALLYAADRAHHVAEVIKPCLDEGSIVVQDRYMDSSIVYQGAARGLGEDEVERISMWATQGALPDLTIVLDREPLPIVGDMDRIERELAQQAKSIRAAFRLRAAAAPHRYAVIDAARSIDAVASDVWSAVAARMLACENSAATVGAPA